MGIPKFYRYISERYPLLSSPLNTQHAPHIDNLYLDMNGIIHNCVRDTPGNGGIDTKRYQSTSIYSLKSPQQTFTDIFKYIDNLFSILPPRRLLYLAIDGVAPRAKMNQQRSRRFRSAKERSDDHSRLLAEDPMYAAAKVTPFDSNCITPGTAYMQQLTLALKYFIANKITNHPEWASVQIILSGAEVPGEGEHKIMQYIRAMRESNKFAPDTRHCVYGLDADLIMLGLVTHEPHFFLLREKIDFQSWRSKKSGPRLATVLDTTIFGQFELLSIGILREYLVHELGCDNNNKLPYFDVERLTDDFIFVLMLIGNDFLPNLPTLDIADGTLDVLLHLYKRFLPIAGGYLIKQGQIIPHRLEFFLAKLSLLEKDVLVAKKEAKAKAKALESRGRRHVKAKTFANVDLDIQFEFYQTNSNLAQKPFSEERLIAETKAVRMRLNQSGLNELKREYYAAKFDSKFSTDDISKLCESYVEGVSWTLKYYTQGCCRWRWFYPYHYAPLASDIGNIAATLQGFEKTIMKDVPFRPLEQLLSVLPPKSAWCLPKPYRSLMTSAASPIREFYPNDFQTDMNGKRNEWESVVLLPFVDERRLVAAIKSISASELSEDEKQRNTLGSALVYTYSNAPVENVISPFQYRLPSFTSMAKYTTLALPRISAGLAFSAKLPPGSRATKSSNELSDLPTLHRVDHTSRLEAAGVNVFGMPSRSESIVLVMDFGSNTEQEHGRNAPRPQPSSMLSDADIGPGCPVWYGYPWRAAGFVEWVANEETTRNVVSPGKEGQSSTFTHRLESVRTNKAKHTSEVSTVVGELYQKKAILISAPKEIVCVRDSSSLDRATQESEFKLVLCHEQFIRRRLDTSSIQSKQNLSRLNINQGVLYIGHGPYFGHQCSVLRYGTSGGVLVRFSRSEGSAKEAAFGYRIVSTASHSHRWFTTSRLASAVGMKPSVVDAVLGSLRVNLKSAKEELDLGFGIKYIGRGLVVSGYARRDEKGTYVFSEMCVDLLQRYQSAFPQVFKTIEQKKMEESQNGGWKGKGSTIYESRRMFGESQKPDDVAKAAAAWISVQDVARLPLSPASSQLLSKEVISELERHCRIVLSLQHEYEYSLRANSDVKYLKEVPRTSLITGFEDLSDMSVFDLSRGASSPSFCPVPRNGSGLRLGDRVVNRSQKGSLPFCMRGTVVGIHAASDSSSSSEAKEDQTGSSNSTLVEVVFDQGFISGGSLSGRCSDGKGKVLPAHHLLIVRPDRENSFYSQYYARVAAAVGLQVKEEDGQTNEEVQKRKVIAKAAEMSYVDVLKGKDKVHREHKPVTQDGYNSPFIAESNISHNPGLIYHQSRPQEIPGATGIGEMFSTLPGIAVIADAKHIREDKLPLPKFLQRKLPPASSSVQTPRTSFGRQVGRSASKLANGNSALPVNGENCETVQEIQSQVLHALDAFYLRGDNDNCAGLPGFACEKNCNDQMKQPSGLPTRGNDDGDEYVSKWHALQEEARKSDSS